MVKESVEIINKLGLHARPSSKLTQAASQFKSEIWLTKNDRRVNAKSIMGVMMLAASMGSILEIEASGEDEVEAVNTLKAMIDSRFGEDA